MREMKNSGVEWLGKIPNHWMIRRIKNLFELRNEKNYEALEDVNLISLYTDKGVVQHSDLTETTGNKAVTADGYKIVKEDDIVVNIILCWMGAVGRSAYNGVTSPAYDVYKPLHDTNSKYYHYLFRTSQFNGECYRYGRGIMLMRWRTYSTEFRAISVPLPPEDEQKRIVNFLNKKIDDVDRLIGNVQKQIEKLKAYKQSLFTEVVTKGIDPTVPMKDSGVEWIGEIPEHWELIRFRYIAKITTGNQDTQNANPEGEYPFYVRSPIVERCDTYTFDGEGILMAGDGAGAGRVFHLVDGKYAVHQRVYRFYDFKYVNTVFLKFYLENMFSKVMDYGSAKTTVPSVRLPMLQDFWVCVPPQSEQQDMISVLSEKVDKIEKLIAIKQSKIEKLEQYKRALIYEYVTGKKEVS